MDRLIRAEFRKLKGSNILWICLVSCTILPLISIIVNSKINAQSFWIGYSTPNLLLSVLLLWPCIFGLIGTFIFVRERIENTYKNLLIIPIGRIQLAIAKLITLFLLIMIMTIFSYLLNIIALTIGITFNVTTFLEGLENYLMAGVLMFISILPIILIVIISKKSYVVSIYVIIVYAITSIVAIWSSTLSAIVPIVIILRICNIKVLSIEYAFSITYSYISLIVIGIVSFVGILLYSKVQDA